MRLKLILDEIATRTDTQSKQHCSSNNQLRTIIDRKIGGVNRLITFGAGHPAIQIA